MASEKTMGIVGYGDIGANCAKVAKNGFNMRVLGLKRNPETVSEDLRKYVDEIIGNDKLDYLLKESDFVVNCLPLTNTTKHLFDYSQF